MELDATASCYAFGGELLDHLLARLIVAVTQCFTNANGMIGGVTAIVKWTNMNAGLKEEI